MSDTMIIITGTTHPGMRDRVHEKFVEHLAARAEANPAQPVVVWAADDSDPDRFHLVEIYTDRAALEQNAQADWFGNYMTATFTLMASEPTVAMSSPRWTKGVR